MFNMKKNKDYTKINLRDFRHNLTDLKDSLRDGEVYEVLDRGNTLAYFVPAQYEMQLRKSEKRDDEPIGDTLRNIIGIAKLRYDLPDDPYYKKAYHKALSKKHLKK